MNTSFADQDKLKEIFEKRDKYATEGIYLSYDTGGIITNNKIKGKTIYIEIFYEYLLSNKKNRIHRLTNSRAWFKQENYAGNSINPIALVKNMYMSKGWNDIINCVLGVEIYIEDPVVARQNIIIKLDEEIVKKRAELRELKKQLVSNTDGW